jgi:hypothetical protein
MKVFNGDELMLLVDKAEKVDLSVWCIEFIVAS